tara:strand:+ start:460 stop:966 length:507 start_codon:yes stop_codon:yes gene_type:complete
MNGQVDMEKRISVPNKIAITTKINGDPQEFLISPWQTLLDVLRDQLGLTGAKEGCGNGNCGACTVMIDGKTADSCMVLAAEIDGSELQTIEGVANGGELHPIQKAFIEHGALQCGFCTPGFIMSAKHLLENIPQPTEEEIRLWIAGNLCRCTGYDKIVRAIQSVSESH